MRKKLMIEKMRLGIYCVFFISAFVTGTNQVDNDKYEPISDDKIPGILKMISEKVEDNYKHIKTWEGRVTSEIDYIYEAKAAEKIFESSTLGEGTAPQGIVNSAETIVEFSLDAEKDYLFAHNYSNKPFKYMDLDTGRDLGTKGVPGDVISIRTKEYYIKCRADKRRGNIITSRKAIKQSIQDCPSCQKQPVFDPREGFDYDGSLKTLSHVLEVIAKNGKWEINNQNLQVKEYKNEKGEVKYQIIIPGKLTEENLIFTRMVFSSEVGFNITEFQVTDANDRIYQTGTWKYELTDNIYLPKETVFQNYMNEGGNLNYSKKVIFNNTRINQKIPTETFTYKNLGLQENDIFIDKIQKKEYRLKDSNLVFVKDINDIETKQKVD
jgi:hypothetical protein